MLRYATGLSLALCALNAAANPAVTVSVDVNANRHAIDPRIYGVNFGTPADLKALNAPLNRSGGNTTTTYNWLQNASNHDFDYFFESLPDDNSAVAGESADTFVRQSKGQKAEPLLTVPMIGWVANLAPGRGKAASFSVTKYGAQCNVDPYDTDAGNGIMADCSTDITGNDPHDAYVADSPDKEKAWIHHLIGKWGKSAAGGVHYYLMDNEPSIWYSTHRDIHPQGPHGAEIRDDVIATSAMIKALDPHALIAAPEEWGWYGYQYDGYDQQYAAANGYCCYPDRKGVQKNVPYIPWLLAEWKKAGHPIDILSVHFYPQGNEYSDDNTTATQQLRNRSTRQLWDPKYVSESYIDAPVNLIPVLKGWVNKYYYAGTPVAVTEYNWGDEGKINGGTTQADIYGIFGREGLDMATRWTVPAAGTPTFKAMQMYRNYDGKDSGFGNISVKAAAPNPDRLSAFAAQRTSGALTVMVINKIPGATPVTLNLGHFTAAGTAASYQLTSANTIKHLANVKWSGGKLKATVPSQSITLFVLPK
ncbi:MAG TPA: glycoside hydrolase family 44 protein [Alphaproteobacteria bacterium]|nr:glycoside hydrolase family 44 protein [Alphaproteobacteria bacterium]